MIYTSIYHVRHLRLACRCAHCIDEWTQERKLNQADVPADIRPVQLDSVGRYALRIVGPMDTTPVSYSFTSLRRLCECPQ